MHPQTPWRKFYCLPSFSTVFGSDMPIFLHAFKLAQHYAAAQVITLMIDNRGVPLPLPHRPFGIPR